MHVTNIWRRTFKKNLQLVTEFCSLEKSLFNDAATSTERKNPENRSNEKTQKIDLISSDFFLQNFFLKILEHTSPFCGATDTPAFDFW